MKCDACGVEIPVEECEFAQLKKVINGKEYYFCCYSCEKIFGKKK
ncbi:MAG: hypothetical protein ACE5PM_06965 [Candidatus Hydrothermarchaeales archaeon]